MKYSTFYSIIIVDLKFEDIWKGLFPLQQPETNLSPLFDISVRLGKTQVSKIWMFLNQLSLLHLSGDLKQKFSK